MPTLRKIFYSIALLVSPISLQAYYGSCHWNGCSCLENIYVGVEGGFTSSIGTSKSSVGVDSLQNGIATNARFLPGWHVGGDIGYEWFEACIAVGASYTLFSSEYLWDGILGNNLLVDLASTNLFKAKFESHVVLFDVYVNLDRLCCSPIHCACVAPYLFGGIGAAWNHLHHIKEIGSSGEVGTPAQLIARVESNFHSNFAGRFGLGFKTFLSDYFTFNVGVHLTYIGEVRSGDNVTFLDDTEIPITAYSFKDNWLGSFFFDVQYTF